MFVPFNPRSFSVETSGDAEVPYATFDASPHHESIPRLVNEERTGNARECSGANEHSDLFAS